MSKKIIVEKTFSKGIAISKAFIVPKIELKPEEYFFSSPKEEIEKLNKALKEAKEEIEELAKNSDIFAGHSMIVEDIILYENVLNKINNYSQNVQIALFNSINEIVNIFENMNDEYMRERGADVKDVGNRIMCKLKGIKLNPFEDIKEDVILIAQDLNPSDFACINLKYLKGIITEEGGITSHISIISKNLSLPALIGVSGVTKSAKNNDIVIIDALNGEIIINPDKTELEIYKEKKINFEKEENLLKELETLDIKTKDGKKIQICANVGSILDIGFAIKHNIDGIGLFRTEFLYMENSNFPTEEQQFEIYKKSATLCKEKELIIRTLDIGGDKALPYYKFEYEENPFLGWRAIRISLELKQIFKTQLKAILRASAFGNVKIMYPMIISLEEIIFANKILEECKNELKEKNIAFNENIPVGIMIETPAAVLLAEEFAKCVDFFSIGTNDLTQYLLAVDRGNKKIAHMYNSFHPAVLKSIKNIIDAGHKHNIKVGMCGEFASDEKAFKILLGFGLDEFSMSVSEINKIKKKILETSFEDAKNFANEILEKCTIEEIMEFIK